MTIKVIFKQMELIKIRMIIKMMIKLKTNNKILMDKIRIMIKHQTVKINKIWTVEISKIRTVKIRIIIKIIIYHKINRITIIIIIKIKIQTITIRVILVIIIWMDKIQLIMGVKMI